MVGEFSFPRKISKKSLRIDKKNQQFSFFFLFFFVFSAVQNGDVPDGSFLGHKHF